jgi:hypothetical protein
MWNSIPTSIPLDSLANDPLPGDQFGGRLASRAGEAVRWRPRPGANGAMLNSGVWSVMSSAIS